MPHYGPKLARQKKKIADNATKISVLEEKDESGGLSDKDSVKL